MAAGTVAAVYAQALLELADERGRRADVVDDCRELVELLRQRPDLFAGMEDPKVGKVHAKDALGVAFHGKIKQETFDLLRLLVDRNRLRDLPAIAAEAIARAERAAGTVHVTATTAEALSSPAQARLTDSLKRLLGQGVVLHTAVDPSLIGGLTLRVDDLFVDGSVRRQLAEMKSLILNAPLRPDLWEGQPEGVPA
ncbi:MAG: ATP synthase F1 subunit delta [Planctomycetes bacterium]|nr:ATP synthase F1 subunit delta [Planctomycetota bacterium]